VHKMQLLSRTPVNLSVKLFLKITEWLAVYHDQPFHTSALHCTLRDLRLMYKVLRKAAAERDEIGIAIREVKPYLEERHQVCVDSAWYCVRIFHE